MITVQPFNYFHQIFNLREHQGTAVLFSPGWEKRQPEIRLLSQAFRS